MAKLIQISTEASKKDADFSKVWPAAGMGYILVDDSGKIIVVDGGETRADAEHLIRLLSENSPERIPTVDLWIITHTHLDHFGALFHIAADPSLREKLNINKMCACTDIPVPFGADDNQKLRTLIETLVPDTVEPRSGDVMSVGDFELRFFFTWRDLPKLDSVKTFNALSLVFTVSGKKRKMMFVGDSTTLGVRYALENYPHDMLSSDYLQLAHHGLDGGDCDFYAAVAPTVVFVPCSVGGARFIKACTADFGRASRYARDMASSVICACTEDVTIEL